MGCIEKIDIVQIPFHDYKKWINEGFRTRDAHLFNEFKKNKDVNKILVINRPTSLAEAIIKRKKWKTKIDNVVIKRKFWQVIEIEKNVYCLDIFSFDFLKVIFERKKWWHNIFENKKIIKIINDALNLLDFKNKVLFLENPMATGLIGKIGEKKVVFDAIDNWLFHPQMKSIHKLVEKNYEFLGSKADCIFTVSYNLCEYFKEMNLNTFWISNGVDIEWFEDSIVDENEKREKPVIGYMGKIQERVDFNIIEECLKKIENNIMVIGPIYAQKDKIKSLDKKYKNIEFTGDVHYEKLPKIMHEFDIAIIPHKVDKFTNSMSPLKIYEYLAAGKQIVMTPIAGKNEFSDYVYLANTSDEFIKEIKEAIERYEKTPNISSKVKKVLKLENSWNYKAKQIVERILNE